MLKSICGPALPSAVLKIETVFHELRPTLGSKRLEEGGIGKAVIKTSV